MEIKELSKITSKLMSDKPSGYGCECNVYLIPNTKIVAKHYVGHGENDYGSPRMKYCTSKSLALFAYRMSVYAAHHGFGPKVYGFDSKRNIIYTEYVTPYRETEYYANPFSNHEEFYKIIDEKLKKASKDSNSVYRDSHAGNLGLTADGEWVIIDFGQLGWKKFEPAVRMMAEIFGEKQLRKMFDYYGYDAIAKVIKMRKRVVRIRKWVRKSIKKGR